MENFTDKIYAALVTGGTRGIGKAISKDIAKKYRCKLFLNYVQNDSEAEKTSDELTSLGAEVQLIKVNLSHPDEIDMMFENINSGTNSLDFFIHCAAINAFKPLIKIKPNQWDLTMNVNARSFLLCVQKCLPLMNQGKIIAVSSLGSRNYVPDYGAMGPVKSALETIVKYLAVELAPSGIRVNGITAGFIDTDSIKKFPEYETLISKAINNTPVRRIGKAEDVSALAMFLLSPEAEWICGQSIVADGGISLM